MFVELSLSCAGICQDLESGMNGGGYISLANPFSMRQRRGLPFDHKAMAGIQSHISKRDKQGELSRPFH